MFERYRRIQERRATTPGDEWGFTLIELLIVIIVLGILAAVVVFALGGVTGKSAVSACVTNAKSVETAVEAYRAQNGSYPSTGAAGEAQLSPTYIRTWPSSSGHYAIDLDGTTAGQVDAGATVATETNFDTETTTPPTGCNAAT